MTQPTVHFCGDRGTVSKQFYKDGTIRLLLYTSDGEPMATATVCLAEYGIVPPLDHAFIKNYSENAGILEVLVEAGVVERTEQVVRFGPYQTEAHLVRVLL